MAEVAGEGDKVTVVTVAQLKRSVAEAGFAKANRSATRRDDLRSAPDELSSGIGGGIKIPHLMR